MLHVSHGVLPHAADFPFDPSIFSSLPYMHKQRKKDFQPGAFTSIELDKNLLIVYLLWLKDNLLKIPNKSEVKGYRSPSSRPISLRLTLLCWWTSRMLSSRSPTLPAISAKGVISDISIENSKTEYISEQAYRPSGTCGPSAGWPWHPECSGQRWVYGWPLLCLLVWTLSRMWKKKHVYWK